MAREIVSVCIIIRGLFHFIVTLSRELRIDDKSLFRVYSRGKWSKHGRFYSWWQNLPKQLRSYFYLNGSEQPLTSLDFSGMHLILSYHMKGLEYKEDPYILEGHGQERRKWFKYIGVIAINAKNRHEAVYATMNKLKEKKLADLKYHDVSKLLKDFEEKHEQISDVFYEDKGVDYMAFDSAVMAECFKELMVRQEKTIFGVHDEIMCESEHRDTVRSYMIEAYRKVLKRELVKKKIINDGDYLDQALMPIL